MADALLDQYHQKCQLYSLPNNNNKYTTVSLIVRARLPLPYLYNFPIYYYLGFCKCPRNGLVNKSRCMRSIRATTYKCRKVERLLITRDQASPFQYYYFAGALTIL
jgi:hypothetical protein